MLVSVLRQRVRGLSHLPAAVNYHVRKMTMVESLHSDAEKIYKAAINSVSPSTLVSNALEYQPHTGILKVQGVEYALKWNVKVVAFGKAVLGMVTALEDLIGDHISEGVASIPACFLDIARKAFPQYLLKKDSKIRIHEGAAHNLPDASAECTAREILSLARGATKDELLIALISGGGSALLPCPVEGVTLDEKRQVIDMLGKAGATIHELNSFRKSVSQTKGGKLAEAAFPAKVVSLVLSDVIGDPLDIIASGPTVPNETSNSEVLQTIEKYHLLERLPASVLCHLQTHSHSSIEKGQFQHLQNAIIGSNRIATKAACTTAQQLGYNCHVWSHCIQGEARLLGEVYSGIADTILKYHATVNSSHNALKGALDDLLHKEPLATLVKSFPDLQEDFSILSEGLAKTPELPLCLISGGEPTVTVKGNGNGGRNQELALSFALHVHPNLPTDIPSHVGPHCLFLSVGTDGQDGPYCEAAGAMADRNTAKSAHDQRLDAVQSLENNDSYNFFSQLRGGKQLIHTGLTGTNVMDLQVLMMK